MSATFQPGFGNVLLLYIFSNPIINPPLVDDGDTPSSSGSSSSLHQAARRCRWIGASLMKTWTVATLDFLVNSLCLNDQVVVIAVILA